MGNERKKDSDAKYLKRLLTAFDQRAEDWPIEPRPIDRYQSNRQQNQNRKMRHPVGSQIGLVVRIKRLEQISRKDLLKLGHSRR